MLNVADFASALNDPERAPPTKVAQSGNRFDIYRNNVAASLVAALAQTFPVVERMVGVEYFAALALAFVRQSPPTSPILAEYGAGFPVFVETFPPLADYPYLADMARLELARIAVMRAADTPPAGTAGFADDAARLLQARLTLQPAARLVASPYPVATLWKQHQEGTPQPLDAWPGERLLIFRTAAGLVHAPLSVAEFAFLGNLQGHAALGDALFALGDQDQAADLLRVTANLLKAGALIAEPDQSRPNPSFEKI